MSYQDRFQLVTVHTHGALLGDQATGIMMRYPTLSRYPDIVLTLPCCILLMHQTNDVQIDTCHFLASNSLGSDKYKFVSH